MKSSWFKALEAGGVAVCATKRLKRELERKFEMHQRDAGRTWWPRPTIHTLNGWLSKVWEDSWLEGTVAADPSVEALWETVIAKDARARGFELLDVEATAGQAREAYRLINHYAIEDVLKSDADEESGAFKRWRVAFEAELARRGWLDSSQLPGRLAVDAADGNLTLPQELLVFGKDDIEPAFQGLFDALEAKGCHVEKMDFPDLGGTCVRVGREGPEEEVRSAAAWALSALQQNPSARLGVVAVDMESYSPLIKRIFAETLAPEALMPGGDALALPFDLSLDKKLFETPVAHAALELLAFSSEPFEPWRLRALLLNPFWSCGEPVAARARGVAHLLSQGSGQISVKEFAGLVAKAVDAAGGAGGLEGVARVFGEVAAEGQQPQLQVRLPSEWARVFMAELDKFGWAGSIPGTAGLGSAEFQAAKKLRDQVAMLGVLDSVLSRVNRSRALRCLRKLCKTPFQPEGGDVPVVVMGLLEAAGLTFDGLWVLGADADALPPGARPNPFIPYRLQREAGVRQATPEGQLRHAEAMVKRIVASADEVVLSYPKDRAGCETLPSPLISKVKEIELALPRDTSARAQLANADSLPLERVEDAPVALTLEEGVRVASSIFASQALCPFMAFVYHRLGGKSYEANGDEGLDAAEQGTGVHHALWLLHGRFPRRQDMEDAGQELLEREIAAAAGAAVRKLERDRDSQLLPRLKRVEERRLVEVLRKWVEFDLARPEFEVIEREAVRQLVIGELELEVRLDRLERTEEGGELILDYKTGAAARPIKRLFEERLVEPQLPLYALACPEARGVGYAQLDRGRCAIKGVGDETVGLGQGGGSEELDWEELRLFWQERLEDLAEEYSRGENSPHPDRTLCERCEAGGSGFCRRAFGGEG